MRVPKNRVWELRSSSRRRALSSKLRENVLNLNFRVGGVDFSKFRRQKRGNFSRKFLKIARIRRCARHAIAFADSVVVRCFSKCAPDLSATDVLHLRHRFFNFLASKSLRFFAQNSLSACVRRCASQKIAFRGCTRLGVAVRCFRIARKHFSNGIFALAASLF